MRPVLAGAICSALTQKPQGRSDLLEVFGMYFRWFKMYFYLCCWNLTNAAAIKLQDLILISLGAISVWFWVVAFLIGVRLCTWFLNGDTGARGLLQCWFSCVKFHVGSAELSLNSLHGKLRAFPNNFCEPCTWFCIDRNRSLVHEHLWWGVFYLSDSLV